MTDRERDLEAQCAALREALEDAREACRANLVYAQRKDEPKLLAAFNSAERALSLTASTAAAYTARIRAEERERCAEQVREVAHRWRVPEEGADECDLCGEYWDNHGDGCMVGNFLRALARPPPAPEGEKT
jgi:hypothetical protein